MKARITVVTLGVDDLDVSLAFYRDGLGLKTNGIVGTEFDHGAVVFFDLESGLKLALWPRKSLSHDSGVPVGKASPTEFSIGHNVRSKNEVDDVMAQAKKAGATVVKEAHDTFWDGYAGYFQDPDGHLWEVAWNPQLLPQESQDLSDEAQIRALIARWSKAVREENLPAIRSDHDANILMFDVPPPFLSRGLDAYMATWETFFSSQEKPVAFDFDDVEVTCGQDVAFATAVGRCVNIAANGKREPLEFRLTMGLRKIDGNWRVMHEHHSLPATQ